MKFYVKDPFVFVPVEVKQSFSGSSRGANPVKGAGQLAKTILKHFSKISVLGGKRPGILIDRTPPEKLTPKVKGMLIEDDSEADRLIYGLSTEPEAITFSASNWNNPDGETFTITKDNPQTDKMIKILSGDL